MTEREITSEVDLTDVRGRLNPDAVGWTRTPHHGTDLPGWGRRKRWEYWAVVTPEVIVGMTVSSLDYAGVCGIYALDRATGREHVVDVVAPLARGVSLAGRTGTGSSSVVAGGLHLSFEESGSGTRLRALTPDVDLDVVAAREPGHESLGVVVPWSARRYQYTVKDIGRPASGSIHVLGRTFDVDPATAFAVLDHGRGRWPYAITWNWGAGHGTAPDGRRISLQVGGKWTDGTGSTENALFVDGRLHKISEDLAWEYDRDDWTRPWRIHGERVDATLEVEHERRTTTNLAVVASEIHQCFGTWRGWALDDDGARVPLDGLVGWAEEARNRW